MHTVLQLQGHPPRHVHIAAAIDLLVSSSSSSQHVDVWNYCCEDDAADDLVQFFDDFDADVDDDDDDTSFRCDSSAVSPRCWMLSYSNGIFRRC